MSAAISHSTWQVHRTPVTATGGMVGAKVPAAADAGVAMLRKGGNAIDAAVATAFAAGVAEPMMNGIGGGGFMCIWLAAEQRFLTIDFPMISGSLASPEMFPLAASGRNDSFLFGWPATIDSANTIGYGSIAVPGTLAGLAKALEAYGTLSLREVLEPAIELAETGFPITWFTTLQIAKDLANLRRFPETARTFLTDAGMPPVTAEQRNPAILRQPDLARTLRAIADKGAGEFYAGELGMSIASHLQESGSPLTPEDFARYGARETSGLTVDYHGHRIHTVGGASGGTSLAQTMTMLNQAEVGDPYQRDIAQWHRMATIFRQAFADRFAWLGDPDHVDVPFDALLSPEYAAECLAGFDAHRSRKPSPGSRGRLGVKHTMPASVPEYVRDGSTTHLGAIDAAGNAVSLTQTLLGGWGSRVVVPGTGVLMNNGMMWFDPQPGRPNSVAAGKRPLANMAPVLVTRGDRATASIGASGGRRITNCNVQVAANLIDNGMRAQDAIEAPRIDTSTVFLAVSSRIPEVIRDGLRDMGHDVSVRDETQMTSDFASPIAIRRSDSGGMDGGADPWYFPATVAGLDQEDKS